MKKPDKETDEKSKYSEELRAEIIGRVESKEVSQRKLAGDTGIPVTTINKWVKAYRAKATKKPLEQDFFSTYASITFGSVLAKLRYAEAPHGKKPPSTEDFARTLGVSGSSLRMLESGQQVPQIKFALSLATACKLSASMTVLVISFVRAIDDCNSKEQARDVAKSFEDQVPQLSYFARRVNDALSEKNSKAATKRLLKNEELTSNLVAVMKSRSKRPTSNNESTSALDDLSPVILDAVKALNHRLKFFNPSVDKTFLARWEEENSERIQKVWAYYDDLSYVYETIKEFNLDFIDEKKGSNFQYLIFSEDEEPENYKALEESLMELLPAKEHNLCKVYRISKSKSLRKDFDRALWFDLGSGKTCFKSKETTDYIKKHNGGRYIRMTSLNFYEIKSYDETTICAFIDNSKSTSGHSSEHFFYARALSREDVSEISALFKMAEGEMELTS